MARHLDHRNTVQKRDERDLLTRKLDSGIKGEYIGRLGAGSEVSERAANFVLLGRVLPPHSRNQLER